MKLYTCLMFSFLLILFGNVTFAQHNHDANARSAQLEFAPVLNTFLSDPDVNKYQLQSSLMTVPPSLVDTVSHRHDADLFGYVIEGTVEVGLDHKDPIVFKAGQMFHEKRNVIHSLLRNPNKNTPAKVLLIFIIKEGRQGYTKEYSEN